MTGRAADFRDAGRRELHAEHDRQVRRALRRIGGLFALGLVENVLNTRKVIAVHAGSGLPNIAGTEFIYSRNPQIPEIFLVEGVLRDFAARAPRTTHH